MKFIVEVHFLDSYNQDPWIEFDNYTEARAFYLEMCAKFRDQEDVFVCFLIRQIGE